jgi:hypothetical protein
LCTGRGTRVLAIVETYTRECLTLEVDTNLGDVNAFMAATARPTLQKSIAQLFRK